MSLRRVAVGLLSVAGLVLGGAAPAAQASSGSIFVCDAYYCGIAGSPPENVGLLSVTIASSSPLTSLDVSLSGNGNPDALDLHLSDFVAPASDGTGQWATWTLKNPITTGQLALGQYSVQVTAADSGGDTVTSAPAGTLYFENEVLFPTFTSNGTTFDYDHQDVTFSGTAAFLPVGGSAVPLADDQLELTGTYSNINTAITTDSSGAFSVTVPAQTSFYWVDYAGNRPNTAEAASSPISITVNQDPAHIAATFANPNPNQGAPDSISGTATYTGSGGSRPLAGVTVSLYSGWYPGGETPTATSTTDATGHFTMPVPTTGYGYWSVATASTPYLQSAQTNLQFTVAQPNSITTFHASLSPFAVVSVSGCDAAGSGYIEVQYATGASGPWRSLGKILASDGLACPHGPGTHFSGHVLARVAAAYYRVKYLRSPGWQGAASSAVYLHRLLTKITNFSVSPHSVARNGYVTVAGRLWAANRSGRTWHPYGHRKVIVVFRYQGTWYRYRYSPVTSATGRFRHSFRVHASSPFFAQYNGDATHFASASVHIHVSTSGASASSLALGSALPIPARRMLAASLTVPAQ